MGCSERELSQAWQPIIDPVVNVRDAFDDVDSTASVSNVVKILRTCW